MELIKILSSPVRIQVMQYLQIHGEATTKQISEAIQNVPAPTLYRHINTLLKEDVLMVKEERKVRGSLERLLTINQNKFTAMENSGVADAAYQFLMEIYARFQTYSKKPDTDPRKDGLSMRTRMFCLTDEELDALIRDIGAVMDKYGEKSGGKERSISFISAPVEEENP